VAPPSEGRRSPFFLVDEQLLPPTVLMPMGPETPGLDAVERFEPGPLDQETTPTALASQNSPAASTVACVGPAATNLDAAAVVRWAN
jgi:hypothetical protein